MKNKLVHIGIISIFCSLYFLVATISMINSVAFFDLAHEGAMNWSLAIGFELGAAASLAAIIILDKTNRFMVWTLFLLLTAFQMMANSYHAFVNLEAYMGWIELFGLEDMEPLAQKRVLAIVSGAVLPIVALGFIKSLVDYIRPENAPTKPTETVGDLFSKTVTREEVIEELDKDYDIPPAVIKAQKEQIERIEEKQKPFDDKLTQIKEEQKQRIKEKTPVEDPPTEVQETIPEANPIPAPIVPPTQQPAIGGTERQISEAIRKQRMEDEMNLAAGVNDYDREVDVTIKDNVTYVKTRKKEKE